MTRPRFLVPGPLLAGARIALAPAASHHAQRVLRLRAGDDIVVFDGAGFEALAHLQLDPADAARAHAHLGEVRAVDREAAVAITLLQALCAQDKVDWLVEKCIELGVARIVLFPAQRSVVRLDETRRERRAERLREIAIAASSQCGRTRVVPIAIAASMDAALAGDAGMAMDPRPAPDGRWILDPGADAGFGEDARECTAGTFAVGPEGGFTKEELALAGGRSFTRLRLGPRVLRTETAGLAAIAALLALRGEFA